VEIVRISDRGLRDARTERDLEMEALNALPGPDLGDIARDAFERYHCIPEFRRCYSMEDPPGPQLNAQLDR